MRGGVITATVLSGAFAGSAAAAMRAERAREVHTLKATLPKSSAAAVIEPQPRKPAAMKVGRVTVRPNEVSALALGGGSGGSVRASIGASG